MCHNFIYNFSRKCSNQSGLYQAQQGTRSKIIIVWKSQLQASYNVNVCIVDQDAKAYKNILINVQCANSVVKILKISDINLQV